MKTEDLLKKVEAAEQKVEKCRKTIQRHIQQRDKKAKQLRDMGFDPEIVDRETVIQSGDRDAYWLYCDYEYKQDDIKGATDKLADAERILQNWKVKLDLQVNRDKVIQDEVPQVLKDFVEAWKAKAFDWYVQQYQTFVDTQKSLQQEQYVAKVEALKKLPEYADLRQRAGEQLFYGDYYVNNPWPRQPMEDYLKARGLDYKSIKEELSILSDPVIANMCTFRDPDERLAWLDSTLEDDKKYKLLDLMERVTKITGPITDAQYLKVSAGDLNGVIFGEKGAADVNTISAGGYNIQCFHFRCLIHDVTKQYAKNAHSSKPGLDAQIADARSKAADCPQNNNPDLSKAER